MAHAADVHVVAHETVAQHAVRERRVVKRHDVARADDAGAPRALPPEFARAMAAACRLHGCSPAASADDSKS